MTKLEICLPYQVPYFTCPYSRIKIEGCPCGICNQHRKEWTLNHKKEYDFEEQTCHHEPYFDGIFWQCLKCHHVVRIWAWDLPK